MKLLQPNVLTVFLYTHTYIFRLLIVYNMSAGEYPKAQPELPHHEADQDIREAEDDLQTPGPRATGRCTRIPAVSTACYF